MNLSKTYRKRQKAKSKSQTWKAQRGRNSGAIQPPQLDTNISPGDDFYLYVNHEWLKKTEIPPTKSAFGVSEEIEDRLEKSARDLAEECIQISKSKDTKTSEIKSVQHMLGLLAQSVETANSQECNLQIVRKVLSSIQDIQNTEEVAVVMGEFMQYKIRGLLSLFGQYENKRETRYTLTIGAGNLGLPDPSYYYKRSMRRGKYLSLYKHMLKRLGDMFELPTMPCLVKVERILAGVLLNMDYDSPECEKTGSELEKEFEHIPFAILFQTIGVSYWQNRIFLLESKDWLKTINVLFEQLGLDYWKLLLSLQFLLFSLPWLPPEYSNLSFQMYRKELKGQEKPLTRHQQVTYVLEQYATPFFSHLFTEKVIDKSIKEDVTNMMQDLIESAQKRVETLTWLEPKTRKLAQEKVKHMRFLVGFPDSFEHHSIPSLDKQCLLSNLLEMGSWQTQYELQKLGQPISKRKEWDDPVFVVNAYYYSQANEIILPAGILNPPFYSKTASIAWNYGGIGCILGHEMTHAFDKEGKEFDPKGFQKQWWSSADERKYNNLTKALIEFYGKEKINGFPVSGRKTLSENIADIGGMGIALGALQKKLDEMSLTQEERHQAYREFFIAYAVSWRVKEKKRKRMQALVLDKHAPASLRVNLVVSQFQEWYDAFEIDSKDSLYIPPEKRIHIL